MGEVMEDVSVIWSIEAVAEVQKAIRHHDEFSPVDYIELALARIGKAIERGHVFSTDSKHLAARMSIKGGSHALSWPSVHRKPNGDLSVSVANPNWHGGWFDLDVRADDGGKLFEIEQLTLAGRPIR
jgi:hypothetical protein